MQQCRATLRAYLISRARIFSLFDFPSKSDPELAMNSMRAQILNLINFRPQIDRHTCAKLP